ncbi:MAG: vWA domain-containing protein [Bellilinea sp.]
MKHSPEFSKAASTLTCTNVFFTALLYNMRIEARDDLPATAATDGVNLYYNPELFAKQLTAPQRVFALVHELLHVILFHNTRRGIREPEQWNIACDHAANLLCLEYGFNVPDWAYQDATYKGMTAEKIYDLLDKKSGGGDKGKTPMSGDVMDYDPTQNGGHTKADVERAIAIGTEQAAQAAKAAGQDSSTLKRLIGEAQVQREPWHQHLRRWMTSMNTRQYNWARFDSRRAVLHGVVSPQMRAENMGKVVVLVDESGSMTDKQRAAVSAHVSDICRDCTPSEVIIAHFDTSVVHAESYTGPDYDIAMRRYAGGGTDIGAAVSWGLDNHSDAQLMICFTDLYGPFGEDPGMPVLWVSQTETVPVPYGELIYGDLNES